MANRKNQQNQNQEHEAQTVEQVHVTIEEERDPEGLADDMASDADLTAAIAELDALNARMIQYGDDNVLVAALATSIAVAQSTVDTLKTESIEAKATRIRTAFLTGVKPQVVTFASDYRRRAGVELTNFMVSIAQPPHESPCIVCNEPHVTIDGETKFDHEHDGAPIVTLAVNCLSFPPGVTTTKRTRKTPASDTTSTSAQEREDAKALKSKEREDKKREAEVLKAQATNAVAFGLTVDSKVYTMREFTDAFATDAMRALSQWNDKSKRSYIDNPNSRHPQALIKMLREAGKVVTCLTEAASSEEASS